MNKNVLLGMDVVTKRYQAILQGLRMMMVRISMMMCTIMLMKMIQLMRLLLKIVPK